MNHLPGQKFLNDAFREIVQTASPVARYVGKTKESVSVTHWQVWTWYAPHGKWLLDNQDGVLRTTIDSACKRANAKLKIRGHTEAIVVEVNLGPSNVT